MQYIFKLRGISVQRCSSVQLFRGAEHYMNDFVKSDKLNDIESLTGDTTPPPAEAALAVRDTSPQRPLILQNFVI